MISKSDFMNFVFTAIKDLVGLHYNVLRIATPPAAVTTVSEWKSSFPHRKKSH